MHLSFNQISIVDTLMVLSMSLTFALRILMDLRFLGTNRKVNRLIRWYKQFFGTQFTGDLLMTLLFAVLFAGCGCKIAAVTLITNYIARYVWIVHVNKQTTYVM